MKKIKEKIKHQISDADRKWKGLPAKSQRLFTKLFFACYAVVTLLVLISIWISTGGKTNVLPISHINSISDQTALERQAQDNKDGSTTKKQTDERFK